MKKRHMFLWCFVVLVLLVMVVPCAFAESAGQYVDDSVITTKVKALLAKDDTLKAFEINVKTYKGIVQLRGFVDSKTTIEKAGKIAGSIEGVKSVKNDLIVKAAKESAGAYLDDSVITTKVKSLLAKDAALKAFEINVETYKGIVQLSGFVDSSKTAEKAGKIAGSVKGVKSVKNNVVVK
jgi:hyperosmotically inducible periplasmic protein